MRRIAVCLLLTGCASDGRDPGTASRYCWTATQTHTRAFPGTAIAVTWTEEVVVCPRPEMEE